MAAADNGSNAGATPAVSPYQKFAKDVLIIGITSVLVALSSIVTLPLITRTLGADDYGIWAQSWVAVSLVGGVVGLGLPYAMTRFLPAKTDGGEIRDDFYSAVCVTFGLILAASATIAAAAPLIGRVFFDGATNVVRLTALLILIYSCQVVYTSLLRAFRSMKAYAFFTLIDVYGQVCLVAYAVTHGYGLLGLFCGVVTVKSVVFVCLVVYVALRIGVGRPRFTNLREYLRFGVPTIASSISWWVVQSSDRFVIAVFLGTTEVGIYSAGYNLGNVFVMVIGVLTLVMAPTFSKLYEEGRILELQVHMSYSLKYLLLLGIPFVVGTSVLAHPILMILSTPDIASRGYYVVPLIALSIVLYGVVGVVGFPIILAKKTHIGAIAWGVAASANLGLNVLLVPRFGLAAAAMSTLAAYALVLVISIHFSAKEFAFPVDWRSIVKSLAASGVMAAVVWPLHPTTNTSTVLTVLAGIAVYAVVLVSVKGVRKDEMSFFMSLVPGRKAPDVCEPR